MAQILREAGLDPEQQERFEIILDSGKTLLSVLNDVLDLSKIEPGVWTLRQRPMIWHRPSETASGFARAKLVRPSAAEHPSAAHRGPRFAAGDALAVRDISVLPVDENPVSRKVARAFLKSIALKADAMRGDHERYRGIGMSGHIPKPIDRDQLLIEINSVLAAAAIDSTTMELAG